MLPAPQVGQSAAKLFEALEKLGQSAGSGLRSDGPLGDPPGDLVRAFREAMESPGQGLDGQPAGQSGPEGTARLQGIPGPEATAPDGVTAAGEVLPEESVAAPDGIRRVGPGPAERMPPVNPGGEASGDFARATAENEAAPVSRTDPGENLAAAEGGEREPLTEMGRLLERIAQPGASVNPTDLYRLQYLAGMLRTQGQIGQKASQQTTQGLESVLRQQG